jgi:hypothetical protein
MSDIERHGISANLADTRGLINAEAGTLCGANGLYLREWGYAASTKSKN